MITQCEICGAKNIECQEIETRPIEYIDPMGIPHGGKLFICELCVLGNAHLRPCADTAAILRVVCYVGNSILKEVRK